LYTISATSQQPTRSRYSAASAVRQSVFNMLYMGSSTV
jgi:hypothetical protein